ncbi:TPA: hypothetical protein QDE31_37465 [Burkholderia cenocepacia]|uniref:PD-(D/E)XK nuclease family protein n=1 Tax=Burkholderia cenocepacia TaxID=95486 RepID=UPI002ABDF345|nr:PD-(D/E)XK nuclease family protein [Burkholderia cenocepacia]HDR9868525.1 hypothetical protein [Burkholderia cenocepacia]HDR9875395.1 hypothetical protein [Burkholderia cenocepacia]
MKPLPWSHSSLIGFDTCPRQYEEIKVLRNFQDQKNPASLWGDQFHQAAETFIRANCGGLSQSTLPAEMLPYSAYLAQFICRPGVTLAEQEYALDVHLQPCEFLGPDVWMRGIIDVLNLNGTVAHVDDHKTGKNRKKDMQQLIIFALLVFYHHPEIQTVHTAFHWVQHGFDETAKDRETFHRHQIPQLWLTLLPRLQRYKAAFDAGIFPPKPSGLCRRHCAVTSCEYHGKGPRR